MWLFVATALLHVPLCTAHFADNDAPNPLTGTSRSARTGSYILQGQLHVDGQPFFPVGMYVHDLSASDWQWAENAGLNTVVAYTNGGNSTRNLTDVTKARSFLDAAASHRIKVFLSLKEIWKSNYDSAVAAFVTKLREHSALLGWYVNDEFPPSRIPALEQRQKLLSELDPHHVTYSVEGSLGCHENTTAARRRCLTHQLKRFRNTSTLYGVDPYPWTNATGGWTQTADLGNHLLGS